MRKEYISVGLRPLRRYRVTPLSGHHPGVEVWGRTTEQAFHAAAKLLGITLREVWDKWQAERLS